MDYSHDAYFAGTQPPYHQFPVGITPLTPSNSAGSENFNTSPQVSLSIRDSLSSFLHVLIHDAALSNPLFLDLSCSFSFAAHITSAAFLLDRMAYTTFTQNTFEQCPGDQQYQDFDPYASHFHPPSAAFPGVPGPPTPPNQHPIVHDGQHHPQHGLNGAAGLAFGPTQADGLPITKADSNGDLEANARQGSNSEEDDSTPAQTRRKAQNRAA